MFGTTFEGAEIVQSPAGENAKRHMMWSSAALAVVTPIVGIACFLSDVLPIYSVALAVIAGYCVWASYWGAVAVSRVLTADHRGTKVGLHAMAHHLNIYGLIGLPLTVGILYGTLGGGVYEFLKQRQLIRNPGGPAR